MECSINIHNQDIQDACLFIDIIYAEMSKWMKYVPRKTEQKINLLPHMDAAHNL